jgi:hypothetical protein
MSSQLIYKSVLITFFVVLFSKSIAAQALVQSNIDSTKSKSIHTPKKAIIRSSILPGWGQVTNQKAWKVPFVYGALGSAVYLFGRNLSQFKEAKSAYILATDNIPENDIQIPQPYYSVRNQPERIRVFRNQVRQNMDYSILFFIACWGLNVMDAAVDAHLKTYDVSESLTLSIHAGSSNLSGQNGVGIILNIK